MGPGCFYPGNPRGGVSEQRIGAASMVPGCFYPGNAAGRHHLAAPDMLQWGRDVSIPEITLGRLTDIGYQTLQWGRDVSIPEIPAVSGHPIASTGFNGAGMFLSRKFGRAEDYPLRCIASMGPGCFYPGNEMGG